MTLQLTAALAAAVLLAACEPQTTAPEGGTENLPAMRVDLSQPAPSSSDLATRELVEQQSPVEGGGVFVELGERGIRHNAAPSSPESASKPVSSLPSAPGGMAGLRAPGSLPSQSGNAATSAVNEPLPGASRSAVGLVETMSPVEGGGVMIDLQGRFMSFATVETGPDGEQVMRCQRDAHSAGSSCPDCAAGEEN